MADVISREIIDKHNVQKYNFKVIPSAQTLQSKPKNTQTPVQAQEDAPVQKVQQEGVDASALSNDTKDSLIESLMKKTDEMSSNFIKLQMKLEQKEEEFEQQLKQAKEEAFAEGLQAGKAQAMQEIEQKHQHALELYTRSLEQLDGSAQEFHNALEKLHQELVHAALDIAKEVIKIEISQNSSEIAHLLASELIADLQTASKITVKTNPKDFTYLSEHLATLKNIHVVADGAISEGGVVVLSDVGNIDAQISKRFERVKKAALSE